MSDAQSSTIPLIVVLVTPAHLSLLDEDNAFISNLLRQEIEISQPGQVFDVMAAVVDRIPHPSAGVEGDQLEDQATNSHVVAATSVRDGLEGISVAVLNSSSTVPNLWSIRQMFDKRETTAIQQNCTLSFIFPVTESGFLQDVDSNRRPRISRRLQLPVASTLFQNGSYSTMFAQRYLLKQDGDSEAQLVLNKKTLLSQQTLNMNSLLAEDTAVDHYLRPSLTQITPARAITAAVGNVIRRINVGGTSEDDVPASQELENAISTGIKYGRIPAQTAGVWALVKPREHGLLDEPEFSKRNSGIGLLQSAVLSGCRLHKVLSGGGGWGEKQGLLALDPDSDYTLRQEESQFGFGADQNWEADKRQTVGKVVKPGDMVTFFVCSSSLTPENVGKASPDSNSTSSALLSIVFGSLYSSMDAMPDAFRSTKLCSEDSSCVMVKGHFGMLSEQGMSLSTASRDRGIKRVSTKLDAPYTIYAIRGRDQKSSASLRPTIHQSEAKAVVERPSKRRPAIRDTDSCVPDEGDQLVPGVTGPTVPGVSAVRLRRMGGKKGELGSPNLRMQIRKREKVREQKPSARQEGENSKSKPQAGTHSVKANVENLETLKRKGEPKLDKAESTASTHKIRFIANNPDGKSGTDLSRTVGKSIAKLKSEPVRARRHLSSGKAPKARQDQILENDTPSA